MRRRRWELGEIPAAIQPHQGRQWCKKLRCLSEMDTGKYHRPSVQFSELQELQFLKKIKAADRRDVSLSSTLFARDASPGPVFPSKERFLHEVFHEYAPLERQHAG